MVLVLFNNLTNKDKTHAVERLISASTPSQDFFLMVVLAVATATFGLLLNNVAVIIGSMLIAPILYPILSLSLGISMSNPQLVSRSLYTLLKSTVFSVVIAATTTLLFANQLSGLTPEILSRVEATLPYVAIAIIAGLAGSFALVKPQLNETLPGIAISVALIPPLATMGIGIAKLNWVIISGSMLLFLVNAVGIVFAGMLTFSMMNFYVKREKAEKVIKEEDKKVEDQVKKAEGKTTLKN